MFALVNIENPVQDMLTAFLKESAQNVLQIAIKQEVNDFIAAYKGQRLKDGRQRVVNGHLLECVINTGIGTIKVEGLESEIVVLKEKK